MKLAELLVWNQTHHEHRWPHLYRVFYKYFYNEKNDMVKTGIPIIEIISLLLKNRINLHETFSQNARTLTVNSGFENEDYQWALFLDKNPSGIRKITPSHELIFSVKGEILGTKFTSITVAKNLPSLFGFECNSKSSYQSKMIGTILGFRD